MATSSKPQIASLALGRLGGFLMATDLRKSTPPWISVRISKPRIQTDPSFGQPIFMPKMMNPEPWVQVLPSTSTITIRSIRESNGSTTSLITKVSLTTATETTSRSGSVGCFESVKVHSSSPSLVLRLELSRSSGLPFRVNAESSVRCGFSLSPKIHQANSC